MTVNEVKEMILSKVRNMKAKGRTDDYIRAFYGGMVYSLKVAGVITADDSAEILNDVFEEIFL